MPTLIKLFANANFLLGVGLLLLSLSLVLGYLYYGKLLDFSNLKPLQRINLDFFNFAKVENFQPKSKVQPILARLKLKYYFSLFFGMSFLVVIGFQVGAQFALSDPANSVLGVSESLEIYKYQDQSNQLLTSTDNFLAGQVTNSQFQSPQGDLLVDNNLKLNYYGDNPKLLDIGWWDDDGDTSTNYNWKYRQCFSLDNSGGSEDVIEQQVLLYLDTASLINQNKMLAGGEDIRFVDSQDGVLAHYSPYDMNTDQTAFWVQTGFIASGQVYEFCMYYGNSAATSSEARELVFDYTNLTNLYYTSTQTGYSRYNVGSYTTDNNIQISVGGEVDNTFNLDQNQVYSSPTESQIYDNLSAESVIQTTGPISSWFDKNTGESLVPVSFAGTSFVYRMDRNRHRFSFVAPFCDAEVVLRNQNLNTLNQGSFTVLAGQNYVYTATNNVNSGLRNNDTVIMEVSNDCPILVTHSSTSRADSFILYPAQTEWYGVGSGSIEVAAIEDNTNIAIYASNGNTVTNTLNRGQNLILSGSGQGNAPSHRVVADKPVGAKSIADGDGAESTTFLPTQELGFTYYLPSSADYLAISTLAGATTNLELYLDGNSCGNGSPDQQQSITSNSPFPGHARFGGSIPKGACITADQNFFAYFDNSFQDETNLLGYKQGRQKSALDMVITEGGVQTGSYSIAGDIFNSRIPIQINNPNSQSYSEFQINYGISDSVFYTSVQTDGGDIRITDNLDNPLDYWVENIDTTNNQSSVWQQVGIAGNQTITTYLYFNSSDSLTTTGSLENMFTYQDFKPIYYVVEKRSVGSILQVVSAISDSILAKSPDNNIYRADSTGLNTVMNANNNNIYSALGPLSISYENDATDTAVPISYAGTEFVLPAYRDTEVFNLFALQENTNYTLQEVTTTGYITLASGLLNEQETTSIVQNVNDNGSLKITTDKPILITTKTTGDSDSKLLYPVNETYNPLTGKYELYGMVSAIMVVAANQDNTQLDIYYSDGVNQSINLNNSNRLSYRLNTTQYQGDGLGVFISSDKPIAAAGYSDNDGGESFTFLPKKEMSTSYLLNQDTQYISAVSPYSNFVCTIFDNLGNPTGTAAGLDNPSPQTSGSQTSPYPNRLHIGGNDVNDGAYYFKEYRVECDQPVFLYYEHHIDSTTTDETNLNSFVQGRKFTTAFETEFVTNSTEESLYFESGFESGSSVAEYSYIYDFSSFVNFQHIYFDSLSWQADIPGQTTNNGLSDPIRLKIFTTSDTNCLGANYANETAFTSSPARIQKLYSDNPCLKIIFEIKTGDTAYTPTLDDIDLQYSIPELVLDNNYQLTLGSDSDLVGRGFKIVHSLDSANSLQVETWLNNVSSSNLYTNFTLQEYLSSTQTEQTIHQYPAFPTFPNPPDNTRDLGFGEFVTIDYNFSRNLAGSSVVDIDLRTGLEGSETSFISKKLEIQLT